MCYIKLSIRIETCLGRRVESCLIDVSWQASGVSYTTERRQSKQTSVATSHGKCIANRLYEQQPPNQYLEEPK